MSFTVIPRGRKPKPPIQLHRYMARACRDIEHITRTALTCPPTDSWSQPVPVVISSKLPIQSRWQHPGVIEANLAIAFPDGKHMNVLGGAPARLTIGQVDTSPLGVRALINH